MTAAEAERQELRGDFIDRLLAAPEGSDEPTLERFEPLDPNLTSSARDRLVATLRQRDPERADALARLIDLHDFADTMRAFARRSIGKRDLGGKRSTGCPRKQKHRTRPAWFSASLPRRFLENKRFAMAGAPGLEPGTR